MKNYTDSIDYQLYLKKYDYIFDKVYFVNTEEIKLAENLSVLIENYNHSYKVSKNYGYSISCQKICLLKAGVEIYELKMVFGKPFFQYIKHSNGNEYFICGNDLLDFSVFNISTNKENRFVSEYIINESTEEECNNEFWYIKEWIYNSKNNLVAINGQDGMNCSTITLCDFTEPDKFPLHFKNLIEFVYNTHNESACTTYGWKENDLEIEIGEEHKQLIILKEKEILTLLVTVRKFVKR